MQAAETVELERGDKVRIVGGPLAGLYGDIASFFVFEAEVRAVVRLGVGPRDVVVVKMCHLREYEGRHVHGKPHRPIARIAS